MTENSGLLLVFSALTTLLCTHFVRSAGWFADHYGVPKAAEIQNDFGGVLGGPIFTDKTFFFLSLEALRLIQPETEIATVPDLAARQATIPAMQPFISMYPLPKPGAPDVSPGLANYAASFSDPSFANAYSLRIDHQLAKNVNLFARYSHAPSNGLQIGAQEAPPSSYWENTDAAKIGTVGATWTPSGHLVNDTRFNYSVAGGHSLSIRTASAAPHPSRRTFTPVL